MRADLMKLLQNASFGSSLINVSSHTKIKIVYQEEKAKMLLNKKEFRSMDDLGQELYQIETTPLFIKQNVPTIIGFQVLQLAKIRLLEIVHSYLSYYISPNLFSSVLTDTDSYYFALARDSLEEAVIPEKREEYIKQTKGHCGQEFNGLMVRECCNSCKVFDSKTVGVYKIEHTGDVMIALASKSYVALDTTSSVLKFSLKGCNKRKFLNENDPVKTFINILANQKSKLSKNVGFRMRANNMVTYSQNKVAASYMYIKRIVHEDRVSTS